MAKFKSREMRLLDSIFEMEGGYVLNFSNRTMDEFFSEELGINIYDEIYAGSGTSKAWRLRTLLQLADPLTVVRVLEALWAYRKELREESKVEETIANIESRFNALLTPLRSSQNPVDNEPKQKLDVRPDHSAAYAQLRKRLYEIRDLAPQKRGYEFEAFLKELFDSSGLKARSPFSIVGEQIDGSFQHGNQTYLLEAKWVLHPIGAAELNAFHGKVDQKAAWARGVFISYKGFTSVGLQAFGRGRKVICMSGDDIYKALGRGIPMDEVVERKVRAAAETGAAYVELDELFPL